MLFVITKQQCLAWYNMVAISMAQISVMTKHYSVSIYTVIVMEIVTEDL